MQAGPVSGRERVCKIQTDRQTDRNIHGRGGRREGKRGRQKGMGKQKRQVVSGLEFRLVDPLLPPSGPPARLPTLTPLHQQGPR